MINYKGALTIHGKFVILPNIMNRINNRDTDNTGNTNTIIRRKYGFRNIKTII